MILSFVVSFVGSFDSLIDRQGLLEQNDFFITALVSMLGKFSSWVAMTTSAVVNSEIVNISTLPSSPMSKTTSCVSRTFVFFALKCFLPKSTPLLDGIALPSINIAEDPRSPPLKERASKIFVSVAMSWPSSTNDLKMTLSGKQKVYCRVMPSREHCLIGWLPNLSVATSVL